MESLCNLSLLRPWCGIIDLYGICIPGEIAVYEKCHRQTTESLSRLTLKFDQFKYAAHKTSVVESVEFRFDLMWVGIRRIGYIKQSTMKGRDIMENRNIWHCNNERYRGCPYSLLSWVLYRLCVHSIHSILHRQVCCVSSDRRLFYLETL